MKKKHWANSQKNGIKLSKVWVWDPGLPRSGIQKKRIPDPGSRSQKGTGSRIRIRNTAMEDICTYHSPEGPRNILLGRLGRVDIGLGQGEGHPVHFLLNSRRRLGFLGGVGRRLAAIGGRFLSGGRGGPFLLISRLQDGQLLFKLHIRLRTQWPPFGFEILNKHCVEASGPVQGCLSPILIRNFELTNSALGNMIRDVHTGSEFFHPGVKKALSPGSGSATLIEISVSNPVGLNADPDPVTYLNADRIQALPKQSPYF